MPDVVVTVRVIIAIGARVANALVARVVKILALVEDRVGAVVQIRARQASDVVKRVGDVAAVGKQEFPD